MNISIPIFFIPFVKSCKSYKNDAAVCTFERMKKLIGLLFLFGLITTKNFAQDLRVIAIDNEKPYVVHLVEPHQNLFRISRYYQTTIAELKKINQLAGDSIKKGMELFIPLNKKNFVLHSSKSKKEVSFQNLYTEPNSQLTKKYLKTILPVDEKLWDEFLTKNKINFKKDKYCLIGYLETFNIDLVPPKAEPKQVAVIKKDSVKNILAITKTTKDTASKHILTTKIIHTDTTRSLVKNDTASKPKIISPQQIFFEKLYNKTEGADEVEKGTALGMQTDTLGNYQKGFYAFHNDLKVGTIVKLKNPMNDNEVYVKILGKIPELAGNIRCSIKISHDAALYLDALDERFLVEIYHH